MNTESLPVTDLETGLFRLEAAEARKVRLDGDVLLFSPPGHRSMTVLLGCAVIGLTTWIATGHYARTEPVRGILATDMEAAKIIALRPGIVTHLSAREGQFVRRGQPLATIQIDQQYANGARASQEELVAIQSQQELANSQIESSRERARSERDGLAAAIASSRRQRADVENQIALQGELVQSLQRVLDRYRPIAEKGFITKTEIDRREQELMTAKQGMSRLRQQAAELLGEEHKAETELNRSHAEEAAQTAASRSSVQELLLQRSRLRDEQSYVLTAPNDGTITALQTAVGRTVDPTVPLMTIMPKDANVHADIYAPSRSIGFVKAGQEVRLLYDAFPYERFGSYTGHIQQISRIALDPRQIDAPFKMDEPVYRITVKPDLQRVNGYGESIRLQPGTTLTANVILERRSFLDWMLEPMNAVKRRDR